MAFGVTPCPRLKINPFLFFISSKMSFMAAIAASGLVVSTAGSRFPCTATFSGKKSAVFFILIFQSMLKAFAPV